MVSHSGNKSNGGIAGKKNSNGNCIVLVEIVTVEEVEVYVVVIIIVMLIKSIHEVKVNAL